MITMDAFIADFGVVIGIPDFKLDADGQGQLAIGDYTVDLLGDRRDGRLMLSCLVGELPDEQPAAVMARLLNANCMLSGTRGATIGVPAGSGAVILARAFDMRGQTGEALAHAIVACAETAAAARALLTAEPDAPSVPATATPLIRV